MFDYSIAHWSTFLTAAILLNLSPGPDMAFILAQTARHGRRSGFAAMLGIWTGTCLHSLLAALGLSAILATSATAFLLVKWVGVIYLVWLGIQALRSEGYIQASQTQELAGDTTVYRQGILVSSLNPKVAIFFLAFLPQFVVEGAGPVSAQLFLHGILIIVAAIVIEPPLIIASARIADFMGNSANLTKWLDRLLGTLFIGLGVRLALSER